ncbi:uncharacterized protein LOC124139498 [Haliotis rufescens]|uniref:uncharacterized protein LOC124139498 n=1 Tax=Haliotis rufescens TaxID=6454 RepID=UPI00201ED649|nr:uncharacterized protein LOC124139498 [Haliotis rufescens]XP_048251705.1 uncharacterized protein LOC124139498 [Haliotis rufescens]
MEDFRKCTVTGCDNIRIPGYNGRCQSCYSACHQQLPEITINQPLRKIEGLKIRPDPVCLTSGCGKSGTTANGLCLQCYLRQVDSEGQVTTFQECRVTGCKESGYKKLHGFCRRCFSAGQIMDRSVIRNSSAEKDQLCTTQNCEFYGLEEQNGQCSSCFKNYLDRKSLTKSHEDCSATARKSLTKSRADCSETARKSLIKSRADCSETARKSLTKSRADCSETARKSLTKSRADCSETDGNEQNDYSNSRLSKLSHAAPPDIYEPVNSDELFGSGADKMQLTSPATSTNSFGQQTEFTVGQHDCKMLCGRKYVAQCDPYCMTCWEALKLQPVEQARMAQHPCNDVQPSCNPPSDLFKSSGCEKPLCQGPSEQGEATKASPIADDEGQDWKKPESPPSGTSSGEGTPTRNVPLPEHGTQQLSFNSSGEPTDDESPEKKRIHLKIVPLDKVGFSNLCNSSTIICLWNKHSVDNGTHPLFEKIGEVITTGQLDEFRTCLQHDQAVATGGGRSTAACVVHCRYHPVTNRQVANALIRCLEYIVSRAETKVVFPVMFSDDLCDKPAMVMRATMVAISNIQVSTNYTQNLDKFYLCVGSEGMKTQCKQEYKKILADKDRSRSRSSGPKCLTCKTKPASKLKPLSGSCMDACAVFCIQCLQQGRHTQLVCPEHGRCFSPIGHKNTYALLVAGYDGKEDVAKLFVADVRTMERTLGDEAVIGIRKENIQVIQTETPGKKDDVKKKLIIAFKEIRKGLPKDKDHARFFFYYSGHNTTAGLKLGGGENVITPKELKGELKKLPVESIIIILDCCYSAGADIIPDDNGEDFTSSLSSCSKDDSEPVSYIPKLWNLENSDDCGDKGDGRKVYQWSSSRHEEKSSFSKKRGGSFFTLSIEKAMNGECPLKSHRCQNCKKFQSEVRNQDGVFLEAIHKTVCYHVKMLAKENDKNQNPQLDSNDDDDILLSFHTFRSVSNEINTDCG